jgi:hypothetical protein
MVYLVSPCRSWDNTLNFDANASAHIIPNLCDFQSSIYWTLYNLCRWVNIVKLIKKQTQLTDHPNLFMFMIAIFAFHQLQFLSDSRTKGESPVQNFENRVSQTYRKLHCGCYISGGHSPVPSLAFC